MSTRTETVVVTTSRPTRVIAATTRIALGFVYLWAFLDKLFGLGIATPREGAVLAGTSASAGYLSHTEGALSGFFRALAGNPAVDALFMLGLGAVGLALVTGVCLRLAAVGGTLVMGGIYLSSLPLDNNPIVDDHLVYILVGWLLAAIGAGSFAGLGAWWQSQPVVRDHRWLF
ncbi:hypothetical protein AB3M89_03455 [Microbacterium sp. 179-I 3D2 NHS]|uniref:hypothetical protein n=1 Tax=Microbacterium sp. 179-I 3D2 NHS TaxID=3235178 RepID=UPI0039A12DD6